MMASVRFQSLSLQNYPGKPLDDTELSIIGESLLFLSSISSMVWILRSPGDRTP